MEKPIRYGVVGIGGMGANHAKKLQENKYDLIIADNVWEHLKYPYRATKNVFKMFIN